MGLVAALARQRLAGSPKKKRTGRYFVLRGASAHIAQYVDSETVRGIAGRWHAMC